MQNKVICCRIYEAVRTVHQATPHGAYDTPKVAVFRALTFPFAHREALLFLIFESYQDRPCDFVMSC